MDIKITGKHIEVTAPLRNLATEKLQKLERHFDRISEIDVVFEVEKSRQCARATVKVPGGPINASSESDDLYAAIDDLVHKLDGQIIKHKEKMRAHRD